MNSWQQRPQEMQIEENDRSINEYVKTSAFNSRTSTSQSYPFGKTTISLEEGYTFSQQQLKSTLTGIDNLTYPAPFEKLVRLSQRIVVCKTIIFGQIWRF